MIRILISLCFLITTLPVAAADTVIAATAIRAGTVLSEADLDLSSVQISGAIRSIEQAVGLQTKKNLFPGRAIFAADLRQPHVVSRNEIVSISFLSNGLSIITTGRALDGGAVGDMIRVLNASSRKTVTGVVQEDGTISVSGSQP